MVKRKLRHVPGSPVDGHPPAEQQKDSRYSVQDDEPVKVRTVYTGSIFVFLMLV